MLRGNFAMEIWNSGCAIENDLDTNAAYWDELLAQGQRLWGAATDDGHAMDQHCRGWVRVNSENSVPAIREALKAGAFYSSCGPEIEDFYVENGVAHVRCSDAAEITLRQLRAVYDARPRQRRAGVERSILTKFAGAARGMSARWSRTRRDGARGAIPSSWRNRIFKRNKTPECLRMHMHPQAFLCI